MKLIKREEAEGWLNARGIEVTPERVVLSFPNEKIFIAELRRDGPRLAHIATWTIPDEPFEGALLWVTDWGIWEDQLEKNVRNIFEWVRSTFGAKESLHEAPIMLFEADELDQFRALLVPALLAPWDAYVVGADPTHLTMIHHHDELVVQCRDASVFNRLTAEFKKHFTLSLPPLR